MHVMPNKRVKSNSGISPYAHDSTYILHDKNVLDNEDKKSLFINDPLMTQYNKKVFLKISGLIGSTRSTDIPSYDHNTNDECTNVINNYERIGTRGTDAKNEYGNMISIYSDLKRVMDVMAMYRYENRNKDGSKEMDEVIEDSQYVEDLFRNVARNMVVKYTRRNVGCEMKEGFYLCNECMERYVMAERYHESRSVVKKKEDVLNKDGKNEDDSVKVGGTSIQKNAISDIKNDRIGYKTDEVENDGVKVVQTGKDLKRVVTASENTEKDLNKVEKAEEKTLEEKEGVAKKELPEWLVNGKAADLSGAKLQGKVSAMDKMEEQTAKDMNGKENIEKAVKVVNMAMNITRKSEKELNTNINGELVNEITKVNEMLEKKDNSKQKTDESVTYSGKKRCLLGETTVGPPHFKIEVVRNNKDGDYFVYKPEPREKKSVLLGFEAITNEILNENKAFNTFQGGIKMRKVLVDRKGVAREAKNPVNAPVGILKVVKRKIKSEEQGNKVEGGESKEMGDFNNEAATTNGRIIKKESMEMMNGISTRGVEEKIWEVQAGENIWRTRNKNFAVVNNSEKKETCDDGREAGRNGRPNGGPRVVGVSFKVEKLNYGGDVHVEENLVVSGNSVLGEKTNTGVGCVNTKKRFNELRAIYGHNDSERSDGRLDVKQTNDKPENYYLNVRPGYIRTVLRRGKEVMNKSSGEHSPGDQELRNNGHTERRELGTNQTTEPAGSHLLPDAIKSHSEVNSITSNLLKANDLLKDETKKDKLSQSSQLIHETNAKEEIFRNKEMISFLGSKDSKKEKKVVTKGKVKDHGGQSVNVHPDKIAAAKSSDSQDEVKKSVEIETEGVGSVAVSRKDHPRKDEEKTKNMYQMVVEQIKDTLTFNQAKPLHKSTRESSEKREKTPNDIANRKIVGRMDVKKETVSEKDVNGNENADIIQNEPVEVSIERKENIVLSHENSSEAETPVEDKQHKSKISKTASTQTDHNMFMKEDYGSHKPGKMPSNVQASKSSAKGRLSQIGEGEYVILTLDELREYKVRIKELIEYFEKLIAESNSRNQFQ